MGYTYEQLKQMGATPGQTTTSVNSTEPKKKYTYDQLKQMGATPVGQASTPAAPTEKSLGGFISNVGSSGLGTVKGIASAVIHPIETVKSIGKIGIGGVQKLIPGEQRQEENFDALTGFFKDRYGSLEKIKETAYNDPVGFVLDLSTVLTGGGAAATKLGTVSKISKLADVGNVLTKTSEVVNPISQVTKLAGKGLEKATVGKKIGGKDYTMDNLAELDRLGVDRKELPIFATSKSPISLTAEAVASKGIGGQKIWDRMNNIYNKMNDSVDSLVKGKLDPIIIGRNISNAVDDFKNNFFQQKNDLYKEAIIPKPKITADIPGYENLKTVTLGKEDSLFSSWNKQILPGGKIRYTKPITPLFSGNQKPMPASTVQTQKLLQDLVNNEKQALKGYGAKSSPELKTYEGLLNGLSDSNMTTSDVYRTLQKLQDDISYGTTIKTGNNAKLSLIREVLDSEFITTLKQQRPDLAKALDTANTFYRQGVKKINSGIIQSIVKNVDRPDIIVKDLLPKLESLEDVKLLVDVLGQKNMVDLRRSLLDSFFTEAKGIGSQNLQPLGVSKQIKKMGEDKLKILLDPDQFEAVKDLEQISKMMSRSSKITGGSQTSFNLLSTVGGGSVMTAITLLFMGNVPGAILSLSPLLGTIGATKFINSSFGRKILTEGIELTGKTGRNIQQAAPAVGKASLFGQQIQNIKESQY